MYFRSLILSSIAVFLVGLLSLSCTHHLVPSLQRVNSTRIPDISTNQKIKLENAQDSTEKIVFFVHGGIRKWESNLNELTEKAIELLTIELKQRGAVISDEAEKVLKLAVIKAERIDHVEGYRRRARLTLQVETGDGYNKEFAVENLSPGHPDRVMGGAITLALTDMFNDQNILEYIK